MKALFFKFHRWLALLFALPLIAVVLSGLVLSFEPAIVTQSIDPGFLTQGKVQALLNQHDPDSRARMLFYRSYDHTLSIGAGRGQSVAVDVDTGQIAAGTSLIARVMGTARGLHETLLISANWIVVASTVGLLAVIVLGALMGWPRFSNTWGGWHKGVAWGLLPFLVLSPLTGLLISLNVSFAAPSVPSASAQGAPPPLSRAVQVIAKDHDLSSLVWIRSMGGRLLARLAENGEYRLYTVTTEGMQSMARNWPRLLHEGNFAGSWSSAMNVAISIAMIALMVTGTWVWARRKLRAVGKGDRRRA